MALGPISNNGFAEKLPKFCSNSAQILLKLSPNSAQTLTWQRWPELHQVIATFATSACIYIMLTMHLNAMLRIFSPIVM